MAAVGRSCSKVRGPLGAHRCRRLHREDMPVRRAQSAWGFVGAGVEERCAKALEADLKSGAWDERHGHLRQQPFCEGSLRLIIGRPAA